MKAPDESGSSKRCANCNTERYGIYRRGYCRRCYHLILQKRKLDRWNPEVPSTLPRSIRVYSRGLSDRELPKFKRNRLKELDVRLWLLKTKETQRNSEVTGMAIEDALQRLAKWSGGKEDVMHGIASMVSANFDQKQRQVLLGWLFDIEESMRWDPRRYWHLIGREY